MNCDNIKILKTLKACMIHSQKKLQEGFVLLLYVSSAGLYFTNSMHIKGALHQLHNINIKFSLLVKGSRSTCENISCIMSSVALQEYCQNNPCDVTVMSQRCHSSGLIDFKCLPVKSVFQTGGVEPKGHDIYRTERV